MYLSKEIPSQSEQDMAREYCLNHKLERPKTDIKTFLKWVLFIEIAVVALMFAFYFLLAGFGISFSLKILYVWAETVVAFVCLKKVCILMIELYQHYAPEKVRRKCMLMPSCSEYALLALRKYNVFVGLYKIYIRLTKKCRTSIYKIDYP
jgi:putative component of membrane protein insertase Oxa1/YidC/SpoIIIJ protein YidD